MFRPQARLIAAAVALIALPAGIAYSTAVLTPKQAKLQGMVVTTKTHEQKIDKLIVKLRSPKAEALAAGTLSEARGLALAKTAGVGMKSLRTTAGGAQLMQLDSPVPLSEARAIAARLSQDENVEYAEPNIRFRALITPTETRYAQWQWNLFAPTSTYTANSITTITTGAANLPPAWEYTTGSDSVVVAVIDTGMVNHPDLNGVASGVIYAPAGRFLPGYDFVSTNAITGLPANFVANDGNGRDADPSDPGDWITAAEKTQYVACTVDGEPEPYQPSDSSWHGSHVAGVVAATANNGVGIAGIGWNVRVVPIRALGKCGGDLTDIEEAIRWAAGLTVANVPANANPAKVINLSLGGGDACSRTMQDAVNAAIGAGAVVVAATGNGGDIQVVSPANCSGVISVTAHAINGENADYANIGTQTTLSAAGGGAPFKQGLGAGAPFDNEGFDGYYIFSSVLYGATGPTSAASSSATSIGPAYTGFVGTSAAAPQVAGVAALLRSSAPDASVSDVGIYLRNGARPYPVGSACNTSAFAGMCGSGLLDAQRALVETGEKASPGASAGPDQITAPNIGVALSGAGKAFNGKTIASYQWSQISGPTVALVNASAASASFSAPATGTLTFRLRVTDDKGRTGDDQVSVRVNSAPVLAAAPPARSATVGDLITFNVGATDVDGDVITFVAGSASTVPVNALSPTGVFSWNTSTTGTTAGTYTLAYFAQDSLLARSPAQTVTITLTGGSAANPPTGGGDTGGGNTGGGNTGGGSTGGGTSGGGGGGGSWNWTGLALLLSLLTLRSAMRQREGQSQ